MGKSGSFLPEVFFLVNSFRSATHTVSVSFEMILDSSCKGGSVVKFGNCRVKQVSLLEIMEMYFKVLYIVSLQEGAM